MDLRGPGVDVVDGRHGGCPGRGRSTRRGCDLVVHTAALVSMRHGRSEFVAGQRGSAPATRSTPRSRGGASPLRAPLLDRRVRLRLPGRRERAPPGAPQRRPYVDTKIGERAGGARRRTRRARSTARSCARGTCTARGSRPWTVIPVEEIKAAPAGAAGARARDATARSTWTTWWTGIRAGRGAPDAAAGPGVHARRTARARADARSSSAHYARMLGRQASADGARPPVVRALAARGARVSRASERSRRRRGALPDAHAAPTRSTRARSS